jgi:hypothetical protein
LLDAKPTRITSNAFADPSRIRDGNDLETEDRAGLLG